MADRAQSKALIGADYLYGPDQDWWNRFQYLSDAAHAIFLLPAACGGTFKEIMWLTDQNLLSKCVFVMPETISETGVHAGMKVSTALKIVEWHSVDHARERTAAQEAILAEAKLLLPDYQALERFSRWTGTDVSELRLLSGLAALSSKLPSCGKR